MSEEYSVTVSQLNGNTIVCQIATDSCLKDLKVEILRSLELDFSKYACDLVCRDVALTDEDSLVRACPQPPPWSRRRRAWGPQTVPGKLISYEKKAMDKIPAKYK